MYILLQNLHWVGAQLCSSPSALQGALLWTEDKEKSSRSYSVNAR